MNRGVVLLLVGIAAVLCLCVTVIAVVVGGGALAAAVGLTQPAADVGDAFMAALRDGDYDQAYRLCTADLQAELGGPEDLEALIRNGDVVPGDWQFTSRDIQNQVAQLEGRVTYTNGKEGNVRVVLTTEGAGWKVAGFDFE